MAGDRLSVMVGLLSLSAAAFAGDPCPVGQGMTYAGRLSATSGAQAGAEAKSDQSITLAEGIKLDRTYQQGALVSSGGGAQSPLASGDIPRGLWIGAGGSDTHGKRWAVLMPYSGLPILNAAVIDENDMVRVWKVTFGLYADTGQKVGEAGLNGGATTTVDVCYKLKK